MSVVFSAHALGEQTKQGPPRNQSDPAIRGYGAANPVPAVRRAPEEREEGYAKLLGQVQSLGVQQQRRSRSQAGRSGLPTPAYAMPQLRCTPRARAAQSGAPGSSRRFR